MASRMGGAAPSSTTDAEAQRLRAHQLQAAARAAAGLPPLDKYTATSVSVVLPPITPTKAAGQGQQSYQPPQPSPHALQQQQARQAAARARATKSAAERAAAARPTPQPTAHEGRLSLTSKQPGAPLVGPRIQELVQSIDPNYTLDPEAEEQVLQIADDFLDKVTRQSLRVAQHRGSKVLDTQDIQLVLAKHWGITIPGLGLPQIRPLKPSKTNPLARPTSIPTAATKRKSATDATAASRKKTATAGAAN